jgi:hypothetical protein
MKYLLLIVTCVFGIQAHALPMLTLSPSSSTLGFNENFTVDVFANDVDAIDPLIAFGLDVTADAGLNYNGATVALPFLDDSGFFATTDVAGSTFPSVSGTGILLATLDFSTGTTEGLLTLATFSSAGDFGSSEGLFTLQNAYEIDQLVRVTVQGPAVVPVPSSFLLLALALVGLRSRATRAPRRRNR